MGSSSAPEALPGALAGPLSRRTVAVVLALLVAVNLALGSWRLQHGLPHVFHADWQQIAQSASLLKNGWYANNSWYPPALVLVYAAAARAVFAWESVGLPAITPHAAGGGWPAFVDRFQDATLQHAVGRAVSVLAGGLLVVAAYRLARVRFSRGVSLLAAAAVAVDPVLVITEHQVRPHVPMAAALVLAAPLVLRLVERAAAAVEPPRRLLLAAVGAGVAAGLAASMLQVGILLAAAGAALLVLLVRPLRRAVALSAALGLGSLATAGAVTALVGATGIVRRVLVNAPLEDTSTLALPGNMLALDLWRRFPESVGDWLASAPAVFAGVLVFAVLCWRGRAQRRDLLLYGTYPLIVLLVMQTVFGGQVRYLLTVAPFLAPLAAAAFLELRPRGLGVALAPLLVLLPLAGSLRYDALLRTTNTRVGLDALLAAVNDSESLARESAAPLAIAATDRVVLNAGALPPGVVVLPTYDEPSRRGQGAVTARKALRDSGAVVYARVPGLGFALGPLDASALEQLGFSLYGTIRAGPAGRQVLPDVPDHVTTHLWAATRTGPPVELWVAGEAARERLRRVALPEQLDAWTSDPRNVGEGAPFGARSRSTRTAPPAALPEVRCDLDGDGAPESVASNADAATLARLLALPAERWRDAGGATATSAAGDDAPAPRLAARGTLLSGEPVLLLLTGAPPRAALHVVVGLRELRAPLAGAVMVPVPDLVMSGLASSSDGALALTTAWPRSLPVDFTIVVQCWIEAGGAPRGLLASNGVEGTTPR
jgi:hypothetical protein